MNRIATTLVRSALGFLLLVLAPRLPSQAGSTAPDAGALTLAIQDEIDFQTVALVKRAYRKARSEGYKQIFFKINTPGGLVSSMEEIVGLLDAMRDDEVETVAWITHDGLSAGALIALECDKIYMASGARIGAATPVMFGGMAPLIQDEVYEKMLSAIRADARARAEKSHGSQVALLAEAMVDGRIKVYEVRYVDKDGLTKTGVFKEADFQAMQDRKVKIFDSHLLNDGQQPLTLTTQEAIRVGLARGRAESLNELYEEFEHDPAKMPPIMTDSWSEELAGFLYSIRFFLLIAGILMVVLSVQMPGTGLPEALALLCFVLFFAGSWLVGLAEVTEILLFVAGVALVIVEIFVVPGTFIAGVAGLLAILAALFLSLQSFGSTEDFFAQEMLTRNLWRLLGVMLAVMFGGFLFSRFLPKVPMFGGLILNPDAGAAQVTSAAAVGGDSLVALEGRVGEALTDLRPSGRALVDGQPYDVLTEGRYLEKGASILVVHVSGNRIIVEPAEPDETGAVHVGWLILMTFVGLLVMVAEVFFPSFGILSVISGVTIVSAVFLSFQHGTGVGLIFLTSVLFSAPAVLVLAFKTFPKTRFGKKLILQGPDFDPDDRRLHAEGLEDCIGKSGKAVNDLHPVGTIAIGQRRYDAKSRGELIESGTDVLVLGIEMSQLLVTAKNQDSRSRSST